MAGFQELNRLVDFKLVLQLIDFKSQQLDLLIPLYLVAGHLIYDLPELSLGFVA